MPFMQQQCTDKETLELSVKKHHKKCLLVCTASTVGVVKTQMKPFAAIYSCTKIKSASTRELDSPSQ